MAASRCEGSYNKDVECINCTRLGRIPVGKDLLLRTCRCMHKCPIKFNSTQKFQPIMPTKRFSYFPQRNVSFSYYDRLQCVHLHLLIYGAKYLSMPRCARCMAALSISDENVEGKEIIACVYIYEYYYQFMYNTSLALCAIPTSSSHRPSSRLDTVEFSSSLLLLHEHQ